MMQSKPNHYWCIATHLQMKYGFLLLITF